MKPNDRVLLLVDWPTPQPPGTPQKAGAEGSIYIVKADGTWAGVEWNDGTYSAGATSDLELIKP